jgi:hypothetical protein
MPVQQHAHLESFLLQRTREVSPEETGVSGKQRLHDEPQSFIIFALILYGVNPNIT